MLQPNQLHHTQVPQYSQEVARLQAQHGYQPGAGQQAPPAYLQAEQALDARFLAGAAQLNALDRQTQAAASAPVVARTPAQPMAPWMKFSLGAMMLLLAIAIVAAWAQTRSPTSTTTPALSAADIQKMIDAAKSPASAPQAGGQQQVPSTPVHLTPQTRAAEALRIAPPQPCQILRRGSEVLKIVGLPMDFCPTWQKLTTGPCGSGVILAEDRGPDSDPRMAAKGHRKYHPACLPM